MATKVATTLQTKIPIIATIWREIILTGEGRWEAAFMNHTGIEKHKKIHRDASPALELKFNAD